MAPLKICYVVVSKGWSTHAHMAWVSAYSVRLQEPSAHIVMLLDGPREADMQAAADRLRTVADEVRLVAAPMESLKARSRYHKIEARQTLAGDFVYLDSDTLAIAPFAAVMNVPADIAAAVDLNEERRRGVVVPFAQPVFDEMGWRLPRPYLNAGVILLRDTDAARRFCERWMKQWALAAELTSRLDDQPAFNVVWHANATGRGLLPNKYNCMLSQARLTVPRPVRLGSRVRRSAILHFFADAKSKPGGLFTHLMQHFQATQAFDEQAYRRAIADGHFWGPEPGPRQFWRSGNYAKAVRATLKRRH